MSNGRYTTGSSEPPPWGMPSEERKYNTWDLPWGTPSTKPSSLDTSSWETATEGAGAGEGGLDWGRAGKEISLTTAFGALGYALEARKRKATRRAYRTALADVRRSALLQQIYTQNQMNQLGLANSSIAGLVGGIRQEPYNRRTRDLSREYRRYKRSQTFGGQLTEAVPAMASAAILAL